MGKSQNNLFSLPDADLTHILRLAGAELESLREQKIFITGGTGFFGKWLLGALCHANRELKLGLRMTVLSRDPAAFHQNHPEAASLPGLDFIQGNVVHFSPPQARFDFIVHAATDTTVFTNDADEQGRSRAIIDGTRRIIDLTHNSGAKRLLNISSGAVYGPATSQSTGAKEDDYPSAQAITPYGKAKREAEDLCAASAIDFVTARAFAFLGPHLPLDAHFAAGNFLRDAHRHAPILVRGDGTALRSYLHPADLAVWLLCILLRGERGRAYNVGSDEVVSTAQLARLMAVAVHPRVDVVIQSAQAQGPQNIYLPNVLRARTELKLDVWIPIRDAIARTLEFLSATSS